MESIASTCSWTTATSFTLKKQKTFYRMMHIIFLSIMVFQGQWLCTSAVHLNAYLFHLPQNNMLNMFNIIKTSAKENLSSSFPNLDITSSKEASEITIMNLELFYFTV